MFLNYGTYHRLACTMANYLHLNNWRTRNVVIDSRLLSRKFLGRWVVNQFQESELGMHGYFRKTLEFFRFLSLYNKLPHNWVVLKKVNYLICYICYDCVGWHSGSSTSLLMAIQVIAFNWHLVLMGRSNMASPTLAVWAFDEEGCPEGWENLYCHLSVSSLALASLHGILVPRMLKQKL